MLTRMNISNSSKWITALIASILENMKNTGVSRFDIETSSYAGCVKDGIYSIPATAFWHDRLSGQDRSRDDFNV